MADGDRSSLYGVARALTRLQALYGGAAVLKGKGPAAAAVRSLLLRMRQELGMEAPITGARCPVMDSLFVYETEAQPKLAGHLLHL